MASKKSVSKGDPSDEIPTSKFEIAEFDDIDDYLIDDFNYRLYNELSVEFGLESSIVPLDFFRIFYRALSFVKANLDRRLAVEEKLREYEINDYYLIVGLIQYADYLSEQQNKPALWDSGAIAHLWRLKGEYDEKIRRTDRINRSLVWKTTSVQRFKKTDTASVSVQLDALPDVKSRRELLIRKRTEARHNVRNSTSDNSKSSESYFSYIEDKLAELDELERMERQQTFNRPHPETLPDLCSEKTRIKRHPDLTIDRAILLIDALGGSRLKSADRDKLADVVAYLTGDSTESVRQRYSALNPDNGKYKGNTENGMKTLQRDLDILSHYFDLIGLRNELVNLSNRLGIPLTK